MTYFGISAPQATNDLVNYSTRNPAGCVYNVRSKRYESGSEMEPVLIEPEFGRDMGLLGANLWPEGVLDFVMEPPMPPRMASTALMRTLVLAAHRGEAVDIRYWSVHSGSAVWRAVSPRAFAWDGLRWHIRAYCHENDDFRDFVIGRIKGCRNQRPCTAEGQTDKNWFTSVTMILRPNPALSENQRKAIEMDYGMRSGQLKLVVRTALLVYTARRLGFIQNPDEAKLPVLNELKQLEWVE